MGSDEPQQLARENAERENFIRDEDVRAGPFEAELVPGVTPRWHAAVCVGGQERLAAAHLIGRRFGIYLPEYDCELDERGQPQITFALRPLIPGYVFVYVWDVERQARRILACPGIIGFLLQGSRIAQIPWELIDRIRAAENINRQPLKVELEDVIPKKAKYRPRRNRRREIGADDIVATYSYSAFPKDAGDASVDQVRALFERAMGIAGLTRSSNR